jgi:hypothetical protein
MWITSIINGSRVCRVLYPDSTEFECISIRRRCQDQSLVTGGPELVTYVRLLADDSPGFYWQFTGSFLFFLSLWFDVERPVAELKILLMQLDITRGTDIALVESRFTKKMVPGGTEVNVEWSVPD